MRPWKTRSRRTVLDHSKYLVVEAHEVELPDGRVIRNWPWVIMPEYVNVLAVTEADEFLFFRQPKYAVEGIALAPVGGYIDPGEAPPDAARRELLEETGYEAPAWTGLGRYGLDANRGCGMAHLFLAQGARRVAEPAADDLEEQELVLLNRAEVKAALLNGEFGLLAWAAVVSLGLQHLEG